MRNVRITALAPAALVLCLAGTANARQLRVSPGPLARAHAALEGVGNCGRCHDAVRGVSAERCLNCHKPIAARIAARTGVHRSVTGDCAKCHTEHRGVEADLGRIDARTFNHLAETGFPLEGQHAKVAARCAACHKKRTFVAARPACGSCHNDVHKAALGPTCTECHSTGVPFKETRRQFDHARAKYALTGAHRTVGCEKCHHGGVFRGLRFDTCSGCHKVPHRSTLGPSCATCHVTDRWMTRTIDHVKTGFTLVGAHAQVPCVKCHQSGVRTALQFDRCSACHANVHRESVKEDCRKCHKETNFREASTFDHGSRTTFPLAGRHDGLACRKCHTGMSEAGVPLARKVVDFGGVSASCATCHKDQQHKGDYGRLCDACHKANTFKVTGFVHPRSPEFFAGRHQGVACVRCHVRKADLQPVRTPSPVIPVRSQAPSMACSACHQDVHLGQVGTACDRCHGVEAAKFAATRFSHESGAFPLTGKHQTAQCVKCHPAETRTFPAGSGTATRLKPMATECGTCHKDPHMGQVEARCPTCHSTTTFTVSAYAHPGQEYTFGVATHDRLPCVSCHKTETRQYPAGWGTALRLKVGKACLDCHR
jgi:hypothetical protein